MKVRSPFPNLDTVEMIKPLFPNPKGVDRRPAAFERMQRIYCLQRWFDVPGSVVEGEQRHSPATRHFVGIVDEPSTDETMRDRFRRLMERHDLDDQLFHVVNQHPQDCGLDVNRCAIASVWIA